MKGTYQDQYAKILENLISEYDKKVTNRNGVTRSRFFETIKVNLQDEFPLMDIKTIKWTNIVSELLWFLNGDTNIKYLRDNGCKIWDDDSYNYYTRKYSGEGGKLTKEEFLKNVDRGKTIAVTDDKNASKYDKYRYYTFGDLDRVYGKQWVDFGGSVNQIENTITLLKNDPNNRRIIVTAHNPKDIQDDIVGLPSCHNMFQFYTTPMIKAERSLWAVENLSNNIDIFSDSDLDKHGVPKHFVSLWFNLRSNDFFLGQPYNMASYSLLLYIIGNITNMVPKNVACSMIDCHLYEDHIKAANTWINRYNSLKNIGEDIHCDAKLVITKKLKTTKNLELSDFIIENYKPGGHISAPLLT